LLAVKRLSVAKDTLLEKGWVVLKGLLTLAEKEDIVLDELVVLVKIKTFS
jgi:hypothetical protein